jgi:hypothetical protein
LADIIETSWSTALSDYDNASNGDNIILVDGTYNIGTSVVNITKANAAAIATLKAQNRGGAILQGRGLNLADDNEIIKDFDMQFTSASNSIDIIAVNGDNCQMSRNRITATNPGAGILQKWVHDKANNFLFDHNYVYGKRCIDDMFLMDKSSTAAISGCGVFYNYFYDFVQLPGDTRSEVIRIGQSAMAMMDFNAEIAYNRIELCDADTEVMSIKSCANNIHDNTLVNIGGSICLRQAHNCFIENNTIINGGIRLCGHGHTVKGNQIIEDSEGGVSRPLYFMSGDVSEFWTDYPHTTGPVAVPGQIITANTYEPQCRDCDIIGNSFFQNDILNDIMWVMGNDASEAYQPITNNIIGNRVVASKGTVGTAVTGTNPASWASNTVTGNILDLSGTAVPGDLPSGSYYLAHIVVPRLPNGAYRCSSYVSPSMVGPNGV